jgi:uncharacterized protein
VGILHLTGQLIELHSLFNLGIPITKKTHDACGLSAFLHRRRLDRSRGLFVLAAGWPYRRGSGIISGSLRAASENQLRNVCFLFGLFLGPVIYRLSFGGWPVVHFETRVWVLALAGLFVGFGTWLGSGCTSGHGVCGLARLSQRSIVAVATFVTVGMITVAAMNRMGY